MVNIGTRHRPLRETPVRRVRDHRIDLVRGFALVTIFINHMPGNWIGAWTPRNFGFSDSAEIFVLLAGYASALAFYPLCQRRDFAILTLKAVRRAGVLYGAHLVTTGAAFLLFWAIIAASGNAEHADLVGMAPALADPAASLRAVLVGGFQLSYFNILPLYVVLLALLPIMLALAALDTRLLVAASVLAYLVTNLAGLTLPSSPHFESWFFNPIAWQSLFVAGLVLGILRLNGNMIGYHPALFAAATGFIIFAAVWTMHGYRTLGEGALPEWLGSLQKPNLPVPRLGHALALAYVTCHCRIWAWLAHKPKDFVLTRMGRHSLPVFMAGSLLSMTGWIVVSEIQGGVLVQTVVALTGLTVMAALALWLDGDLGLYWPVCASRGAFGTQMAGLPRLQPHYRPNLPV